MDIKTDRYLDNLSPEALKQLVKFLYYGNESDKEIVKNQIEEFNKMYSDYDLISIERNADFNKDYLNDGF